MKKLLLLVTVFVSLTITSYAQILDAWTRASLDRIFGSDMYAFDPSDILVEYHGSNIHSITFAGHGFHGDLCRDLLVRILRGPNGNADDDRGGINLAERSANVFYDTVSDFIITDTTPTGSPDFVVAPNNTPHKIVLTGTFKQHTHTLEFQIVSVSDERESQSVGVPDDAAADTAADNDLNRAWAALSQKQRDRLRQDEREWVKQKESLPIHEQIKVTKERAAYIWSLVGQN